MLTQNDMLQSVFLHSIPHLLQRSKECRGHYYTMYNVPRYVTMGYREVIHTSPFGKSCEYNRKFGIQNHVSYKYISRHRSG